MDNSIPPGSSREMMLYDWFKHMTSLSLLTLGGVLSLSQVGEADVKRAPLIMVVLFVAGAGLMSFTASDQLVRATTNGEAMPKYIHWLQKGSAVLFGMGIGAFLYVFLKSLN
jgi:hypothetical protein